MKKMMFPLFLFLSLATMGQEANNYLKVTTAKIEARFRGGMMRPEGNTTFRYHVSVAIKTKKTVTLKSLHFNNACFELLPKKNRMPVAGDTIVIKAISGPIIGQGPHLPGELPYNTRQIPRNDNRLSCPHFISALPAEAARKQAYKEYLSFEVEGREYSCEFKPTYKNTTPSREHLVPKARKDKDVQPAKRSLSR